MKPLLIVVTAPSGAGKTTLCDMLLRDHGDIVYSVSCTTRAPRGNEQDGVDYVFLGEPEFQRRVGAGEFLEHARVHGHWYGTLQRTVLGALAAGKDVLMDIDVKGARQIREKVSRSRAGDPLNGALLDIFIRPPSLQALEARLRGRSEDSEETIVRRLANAREEMLHEREFSRVIVNDDLRVAYAELVEYIRERKTAPARAKE